MIYISFQLPKKSHIITLWAVYTKLCRHLPVIYHKNGRHHSTESVDSTDSTKYPWNPKKFLYILCSIPKPLEVHGVHRQSMDSIYLFVKSVDFIQSPWSPHVNPWIPCIPWTPQGLPGGLKSTVLSCDL